MGSEPYTLYAPHRQSKWSGVTILPFVAGFVGLYMFIPCFCYEYCDTHNVFYITEAPVFR